MSTAGAFFGGRIEVDFQHGVRKDHGAHVAAVGDQSRWLAEGALALEQRLPDFRIGGDARSRGAYGLFAQRVGAVLAFDAYSVFSEFYI